MKIHSIRRSSGMQRAQGRPRGVVLLFVLIALVIIMVASVALVRSFNTAMFTAGNLAFKRDLLNQGERVVPAVMDMMTTGALASLAARANSAPARNYSATILPTNPQGIPLQLLVKDADFTAGVILNDVPVLAQKVTMRYVVDRLCDIAGEDSTLGSSHCNMATPDPPEGGSGSDLNSAMNASGGGPSAIPMQVVYRLTVRVDGPRKTQAFFQTTFTLS